MPNEKWFYAPPPIRPWSQVHDPPPPTLQFKFGEQDLKYDPQYVGMCRYENLDHLFSVKDLSSSASGALCSLKVTFYPCFQSSTNHNSCSYCNDFTVNSIQKTATNRCTLNSNDQHLATHSLYDQFPWGGDGVKCLQSRLEPMLNTVEFILFLYVCIRHWNPCIWDNS